MADYFGTGYLLSIARRGAASIARPGQRTTTGLGERESRFRGRDGQPPKNKSESPGALTTTAMTASGSAFDTLEETGVTEKSTAFEGPASSLLLPAQMPSPAEPIASRSVSSAETQQPAQPAGEGMGGQAASRKNWGFELKPPSGATSVEGLAEATPVTTSPRDCHEVDAGEISIGRGDARTKETLAPIEEPMVSLPLPIFRPSPAEPIASHQSSSGEPLALAEADREGLDSSSKNQVNQRIALHMQSSASEVSGTTEPSTDLAPAGHTSEVQPSEVLNSRREAVTRDKPIASKDLTLAPLSEVHIQPRLRESLLVYPSNSAERQPPIAIATQETAPSEYRMSEGFEIRMPKNFYGNENEVVVEGSPQAAPSVRNDSSAALPSVAARITEPFAAIARAEAPGPRGLASEPTGATLKVYSDAINAREAGEPGPAARVFRPLEPSRRPKPNSGVTPQPAALASASLNRATQPSGPPIAKPSPLLPVARPQPRNEQATHFGRREPPARETTRSSQPRLRINRLEIQVVNQPMAPQPSGTSSAPDTGQLLERRLIGRTGMIL